MASGEAIILGSGTSNGVPMLGVRYSDAFLANPKNHRTRSSCVLQGPDGNFLIDCSPELRLQLVREQIYSVQEVLITHTHADHVMGMDDLRSFCIVEGRAIPIYAFPQHQADIRRIYPYAFAEVPPGVWVPRFDLYDVPSRLTTCGLALRFFEVRHGKVSVTAVRSNDFAYLTDVNFIPDEAKEQLQGLDTLVIDCVRHEPHPNHFNFDGAMKTIEELKPRLAYLTHLSHEFDHDVFQASLPSNVRLAYDGLRIKF
jgi:phosphoribosyl 1,2-cyclic phosphate phosphodiesterase